MENYRSNPTTNKSLRATRNTQGRASKEVNKTKQQCKCLFCDTYGHHQNNCYKRIQANKPCIGADGRWYFPKPKVHQVIEKVKVQSANQGAVQQKEYLSKSNDVKSSNIFTSMVMSLCSVSIATAKVFKENVLNINEDTQRPYVRPKWMDMGETFFMIPVHREHALN